MSHRSTLIPARAGPRRFPSTPADTPDRGAATVLSFPHREKSSTAAGSDLMPRRYRRAGYPQSPASADTHAGSQPARRALQMDIGPSALIEFVAALKARVGALTAKPRRRRQTLRREAGERRDALRWLLIIRGLSIAKGLDRNREFSPPVKGSVLPYGRTTTPFFMTKLTCSTAVMSSSGLPGTATMSA